MRRRTIIATTIGLIVVGLLFRFSLMTYALYAMALAYIISVAFARTSLDGVRCARRIATDRAEIGDSLDVHAHLHNDKALPVLWVLVEEVVPQRLGRDGDFVKLFMLPPKAMRTLTYKLTFTHRGYHQIGPVILESGDLFGFVRHLRTARHAHYITVRPRPVPISRYDPVTRRPIGDVRVRRQLYEDTTRLAGVRPYQVGDPLNRVHWRTTARTGELHTRVYEHTVLMGANIVLDFHEPAFEEAEVFDRSELAITAAASIANYLIDMKQTVGLLSNGLDAAERVKREEGSQASRSRQEAREQARRREGEDRLRPVCVEPARGPTQLGQILDALARLELSEGMPLERMISEEAQGLSRDLSLVIIAPSLGPSLMQSVARLKFWGFLVTVVLVDNPEHMASAGPVLRSEGVGVVHIQGEQDLRVIAAGGL
ncbi:MAG: DUF58 domain-containing protein [Armatimonadetes bacterium]|jgi:uncharacterized protein (DUF58 family)|nr:DUF58 domain-containing protein [Armatimonadota bacterium]MDI9602545.1 DUF58 domain-containing protein [Acidobacteriota bacterium]NLN89483.1 DUF58 domain-containing protein [candidate division WS1 bacterium]